MSSIKADTHVQTKLFVYSLQTVHVPNAVCMRMGQRMCAMPQPTQEKAE